MGKGVMRYANIYEVTPDNINSASEDVDGGTLRSDGWYYCGDPDFAVVGPFPTHQAAEVAVGWVLWGAQELS